jgi:hypothetical protein
MIGYSLILAPLLLRKIGGQPRSNTGKHLFPDRVIFDHTFYFHAKLLTTSTRDNRGSPERYVKNIKKDYLSSISQTAK